MLDITNNNTTLSGHIESWDPAKGVLVFRTDDKRIQFTGCVLTGISGFTEGTPTTENTFVVENWPDYTID